MHLNKFKHLLHIWACSFELVFMQRSMNHHFLSLFLLDLHHPEWMSQKFSFTLTFSHFSHCDSSEMWCTALASKKLLAIISDPSSEGQTWAQETFVCYWSTKAAGQLLDGLLGRSLMNTWWHLTESLMEIFALFKVYSPTKHLQAMES